jgi:hypothetical protein
MVERRLRRWHSGIDTGQESELSKIASALSNGMVPQLSKASLVYLLGILY